MQHKRMISLAYQPSSLGGRDCRLRNAGPLVLGMEGEVGESMKGLLVRPGADGIFSGRDEQDFFLFSFSFLGFVSPFFTNFSSFLSFFFLRGDFRLLFRSM